MGSNENDELSKLRRAIENQRMKAERVDVLSKVQANGGYAYSETNANISGSPETENVYPVFVPPEQDHWTAAAEATLTRNNVDNISPNSSINKRVSSGSLSSVSSHISGSSSSTGSSGPEIEAAMKQSKKKRWQLPLKSAFSKGSKSQSSSQPDLLDSEDSGCPLSPTLSRRNLHTNGSVGSTAESEAIQELLQVVQEKERKLTDIRLEALTSQHQIHQLREQITQMQNEMQLLRLENERLQAAVVSSTNSGDERMRSPSHTTPKVLPRTSSSGIISGINRGTNARVSTRSLSCDQTPVSSPLHRKFSSPKVPTGFDTNFPPLDCRNLQNTLSPDSESEGFQVRFVVTSSSTMLPGKRSVLIGSLPVPRRATWQELDKIAQTILSEYCRVIDGESRLGITSESIESYRVGDLRRDIGGKIPDLLPCAFIVGDVDSVEIKLRDATQGFTDQMSFDLLISRDTLECYVSILLHNRRIVLQGPVGTGKTSFAMSLSEYLVSRLRTEGGNTMVSVLDALQDGEVKLQRCITDLSSRSKSVSSPSLPAVLVVENLHLVSSPTQTLDRLASLCGNEGVSPYIIGTMQPTSGQYAEQHDQFRLISCACDSPHVQRFLTRALRRSMVEHILMSPTSIDRENGKLSSVVLWIPLCWQHINRFLEMQNVQEACIGPKMFLKTPMSVTSSCSWFVSLWNRTIVPHLISATKYARQCATSWEDPSKWVINSFPWDSCETGVNPTKSLQRLEAPDLQQLPNYPTTEVVDEEIDDLPLPPPPVPVRSPTRTLQGPCATSSPIREACDVPSRVQNGCSNNSLNNNRNANIWKRQNGSATLNRTHSPSPNRHFNTVGSNKTQKYTRSDSVGSRNGEDPLKSMLAQLKQAALSTNDDYNVTRSEY